MEEVPIILSVTEGREFTIKRGDMYYKHKQWLEEASVEDQRLSLIKRRKEKHLEIIYLKHEHDRAMVMFGRAHLHYHRALEEYREIDLELSMIDGRYQIILGVPEKVTKVKEEDVKASVKALSDEQRKSLIEELKLMK